MDMSDSGLRTKGGLIFPESKIELTLNAGEIIEDILEVGTDEHTEVEGYVYSSSVRLRLGTDKISGSSIKIPYEFDSSGMPPGEVLKGSFMFVTDIGEYVLPFVATVNLETLDSSMGGIRNLFHFTNLAKSSWDEAAALFVTPGFRDIMTGADSKYRNLYMGLSQGGNRNHNLEEFLIGINKKRQIEYSLGGDESVFTYTSSCGERVIELVRNGWGYTLLAVKTEGDFIVIDDNRIDDSDFEGNICRFRYRIDPEKLHPGRNAGRITFKHLYGSLHMDIQVIFGEHPRHFDANHRSKSVRYSLVRNYIDYSMGAVSKAKWLQQTRDLLEHRADVDSGDIENLLYVSYVMILQERYNEAKWILDRKIADVIEDASNELYCFYLYLTALYNKDEYYMLNINGQIKSIYEKERNNWHIAWILLHTSDELKRNPTAMYSFALQQLKRGCSSPIMYIAIIKMLKAYPALLMHFDEEEIRVLYFAARNKMISDELRGQIAYQAESLKEYDPRIVRMLKSLYEMRAGSDVLNAICTQLIRGGMSGDDYLEWYLAGIEKGLKITGLYENYLMSVAGKGEVAIPKEVLKYFSYDCDVPYEYEAFLYAYIIRHKEDLMDIYADYGSRIERFAVNQLYVGNINRDLACLYNELIDNNMATGEDLHELSKLLLKHMIVVEDPIISSVIVLDERLKDRLVYPVHDHKAYVTLPSSEYTILLEDTLGNRYYNTKEYSTERFFLPRKLLPCLEPYTGDSLLFDLYICEGNPDYIRVNERTASRYAYLEQHEDISDVYRAAIRLPLIRYYQDSDDTAALDQMLDKTGVEDVPYKDREELLRILITRGYLDRAYEYILYYGPESVDPQILVRTATLIIDRDGSIEDPKLTAVIMSAFERGKYNDTVLTYLTHFYNGPAKNLRDIWKAASGFYVDTYSICETMLVQTLHTGAYIGVESRVLKEYVEGGGRTDLVLDYLTRFSDGYLVDDHIVDEYFFTEIARLYENERELPMVCMLAFLKFYAYIVKPRDIKENIAGHIRRYIKYLYGEKGIVMSFMQAFTAISFEAQEINKLTIVEYVGEPGARVTINYHISGDNNESQGYIREQMREVYDGIYVKSFMIFFGETLQYYITEEKDGITELTESGSLTRNSADTGEIQDGYEMINDISMASTLKDHDTALKLLGEYKHREFLVEELFRPQ